MYYATVTPTATNYVLTECSHKKLWALDTGATVTLLQKYVVEECLTSFSFGFFQKIVCWSPTGPLVSSALLDYIVVNNPKLFIGYYQKLLFDKPRTLVPMPMSEFQFEK